MAREVEGTPKFENFSTIMVVGSTSSGKSQLIRRILEYQDTVFHHGHDQVFYVYAHFQPHFNEMENTVKNIKFFHLFDHYELKHMEEFPNTILVVDDAIELAPTDTWVVEWYTRKAHHLKVTFLGVFHSLYSSGVPNQKMISLNCHITIFLSSPRSLNQIQNFARQVFTYKSKQFLEIYRYICSEKKFGYLVVNLHPNHSPILQITSNCIPPDYPVTVFEIIEKKNGK